MSPGRPCRPPRYSPSLGPLAGRCPPERVLLAGERACRLRATAGAIDLCTLDGENLLVFSPAGTAKTLCASLIFSRIRGVCVFDTQMSKGIKADELFGSVDVEQLKKLPHRPQHGGHAGRRRFRLHRRAVRRQRYGLAGSVGHFQRAASSRKARNSSTPDCTLESRPRTTSARPTPPKPCSTGSFRAYISPDSSPFTLLAIDQVYTAPRPRRPARGRSDEQIPLEHIGFLADIVRGQSPDYLIGVPPHVMFPKNVILNRLPGTVGPAEDGRQTRALHQPADLRQVADRARRVGPAQAGSR